ncbi:hypothetical protein GCK72_023968 [Caenorhabditis remanei]|uniref:Uncharacterized protein n=1 Tax=Caenorhabditis remanei TaxID=31234 RepID=A0A6A5FY59_CAERE|nr:hypothetical protein GCK72_023968 [Caenorhabditis remanei]KAF1747503.1 hypothetical protein GCK72_023968 [Caenorhabditis remanei]
MTYFKDEIISDEISVTVARDQNIFRSQQSTLAQSTWSENKSMRKEEEPRPRKDPPQAILLNWNDTKSGRIKEEPRRG